jgi:anti-sigma B factor antagonist
MDHHTPPGFHVAHVQVDATALLVLRGELDRTSVPVLGAEIEALVAEPPQQVILDMRDLSFCDVGGASLLLDAARSLDATGSNLLLDRPPQTLTRIIELLDREAPLEICDRGALSEPRGH